MILLKNDKIIGFWTWPIQILRGALPGNNLGQLVHTRTSGTRQYNLVPVKGRWRSLAAEGNRGPGGKYWQPTSRFMTMSPVGWLPSDRDQLRPLRLLLSIGYLYLLPLNLGRRVPLMHTRNAYTTQCFINWLPHKPGWVVTGFARRTSLSNSAGDERPELAADAELPLCDPSSLSSQGWRSPLSA